MANATETCPPLLAPESRACAGGACVDDRTCACEDAAAWTGHGDFALGSPSCVVNVPAVRGLWSMVAAFQALAFVAVLVYAFDLLVANVRAKRRARAAASPGGRIPRVPWSSRLLALFFGIASPLLCLLGVLRASDPTRTIGTDPACTVLFSLGAFFFWSGAEIGVLKFVILNISLLGLRRAEEERRKYESRARVAASAFFVLISVGCLSPLVMLAVDNAGAMQAVAAVHFESLAVAMALCAGAVRWLVGPAVQGLKYRLAHAAQQHGADGVDGDKPPGSPGTINHNSNNESHLRSVAWRFSFLMGEIERQGTFQALLAAIFGAWPFLTQRFTSYELPIAWGLGSPLVISVLCWVNSSVSRSRARTNTTTHGGNAAAVDKRVVETVAPRHDGGGGGGGGGGGDLTTIGERSLALGSNTDMPLDPDRDRDNDADDARRSLRLATSTAKSRVPHYVGEADDSFW